MLRDGADTGRIEPTSSALLPPSSAPMDEVESAVLRIGVLALRDDRGGNVSSGWSAQLCLASGAGEEVVADGQQASFDVGRGQCTIGVHVYSTKMGVYSLVGAAQLSLAELGLPAVSSSWQTTWVTLRRQQRSIGASVAGALQVRAALLARQSKSPLVTSIQVHRSYEVMAKHRQHMSWRQERHAAQRELVRLVRCGGFPAASRAETWLSVSGARHKKHAAHVDAYAQWLVLLRSGSWRDDDTLSTLLHTIKKDLPRTFPDDNIYANTAQGKHALECVLGAACLHNRQSNPNGGYCQGLNSVAACLLTYLSDADTFWMLEHIQESLCIGYYTDTMVMVNVDVAVIDDLVKETLPGAHAALRVIEESDFFNPMHVHVPKWLIPLFATELPPNTLFRLWDIIFTEGSHVLVCASAAVIELLTDQLEALAWPQVKAGSHRSQADSAAVGGSSSDRRVEQVQALFQLGTSLAFCETEKFIETTVRLLELYSSEKIDQMRARHYAKFVSGATVTRSWTNSTTQRNCAPISEATPVAVPAPELSIDVGGDSGCSRKMEKQLLSKTQVASSVPSAIMGAALTGGSSGQGDVARSCGITDTCPTQNHPPRSDESQSCGRLAEQETTIRLDGDGSEQTASTTALDLEGPATMKRAQHISPSVLRRQQMERHVIVAQRAAQHASQKATDAQTEADVRVADVGRARLALAAAREKTAGCNRERVKAEDHAAAAEQHVSNMVAEMHWLRTILLEKKHRQFLERRLMRDQEPASVALPSPAAAKSPQPPSSPAERTITAQPFDSCLVDNIVPVTIDGDEAAVCTVHSPTPQPAELTQLSTDTAECISTNRVNVDGTGTDTGEGDGSAGATAVATKLMRDSDVPSATFEEAAVEKLQRELRVALEKDKRRNDAQGQLQGRDRKGSQRKASVASPCADKENGAYRQRVPDRQWMLRTGGSWRMSTTRQHAASLFCRTPRDGDRPTWPGYQKVKTDRRSVQNVGMWEPHTDDDRARPITSGVAMPNISGWIRDANDAKLRSRSF